MTTPVISSQGTTKAAGQSTNVLSRSEQYEDPWIGCEGTHWENIPKMLYGEAASMVQAVYTDFKDTHSGIDIYVRQPSISSSNNETYGRFTVQLAYSGETPVPFQAYNLTNLPELFTGTNTDPGWEGGANLASTVTVSPQTVTATGTELRLSIAAGGAIPGKTVDLVLTGAPNTLIVPPWYAVWVSYSCVADVCQIRHADTNSGAALTTTWTVH